MSTAAITDKLQQEQAMQVEQDRKATAELMSKDRIELEPSSWINSSVSTKELIEHITPFMKLGKHLFRGADTAQDVWVHFAHLKSEQAAVDLAHAVFLYIKKMQGTAGEVAEPSRPSFAYRANPVYQPLYPKGSCLFRIHKNSYEAHLKTILGSLNTLPEFRALPISDKPVVAAPAAVARPAAAGDKPAQNLIVSHKKSSETPVQSILDSVRRPN